MIQMHYNATADHIIYGELFMHNKSITLEDAFVKIVICIIII